MANYPATVWIAILALLVSAWTLYRTHFLPFSVVVRAAGRVMLAKNPWALMKQDCLALDLSFTNTGTRVGLIEDIAVDVKGPNLRSLLRTMSVFADRDLKVVSGPAVPRLEVFTAFHLKAYEAAVKRILFVPHDKSDRFVLENGPHVATVYARGTRLKSWKQVCAVDFMVDQADLDALAKSRMVPDGGGVSSVLAATRQGNGNLEPAVE